MGTTLTALVEHQWPGCHWIRVSVWSLGKDYTLMHALHEQVKHDWPLDVHDRDAPQNDFTRYWMDGNTVVDVAEPTREWQSLCASLLPLIRSGRTRVLYLTR